MECGGKSRGWRDTALAEAIARATHDSQSGVAGRCISAEREGIASLRVMPTCMFVGQAAGTAAALAVTNGVAPHQIDPTDVRRRLALA